MSLGPVMVGLRGLELVPEEREMLSHPLVGGVILFTRNYSHIEQLQQLTTEIHNLREPHLLIAVDHEGGRIQRFREGFSQLPPVNALGEIYLDLGERKRAKRLADTLGWLMAAELRAVGIDFSFAPVLDVDRGISQVIGDRAFHRDPEVIADLAQSYMMGMRRAGMAATGKHFPGHGAVEADTHEAIARDERSFAQIEAEDLVPFERMVRYGLSGIMPAHVIYPQVDSQPAGFSRFWLQEILRGRLGFQGVIFSDDLLMEGAAIAGSVDERAQIALEAGCDMALVCNDFSAMAATLEVLERFDNPVSHLRLIRMHGRGESDLIQLQNSPQWQQAVKLIERWDEARTVDLL